MLYSSENILSDRQYIFRECIFLIFKNCLCLLTPIRYFHISIRLDTCSINKQIFKYTIIIFTFRKLKKNMFNNISILTLNKTIRIYIFIIFPIFICVMIKISHDKILKMIKKMIPLDIHRHFLSILKINFKSYKNNCFFP